MPPLLSSPSLPVRVLAAAIAAALLYYSSHSFRRGAQTPGGALLALEGASNDQPSADYVASPNPMRAVGPKPDDRWRAIVETMTAEVQAADAGEVCTHRPIWLSAVTNLDLLCLNTDNSCFRLSAAHIAKHGPGQ